MRGARRAPRADPTRPGAGRAATCEQRGLARAVRPDDADERARGMAKSPCAQIVRPPRARRRRGPSRGRGRGGQARARGLRPSRAERRRRAAGAARPARRRSGGLAGGTVSVTSTTGTPAPLGDRPELLGHRALGLGVVDQHVDRRRLRAHPRTRSRRRARGRTRWPRRCGSPAGVHVDEADRGGHVVEHRLGGAVGLCRGPAALIAAISSTVGAQVGVPRRRPLVEVGGGLRRRACRSSAVTASATCVRRTSGPYQMCGLSPSVTADDLAGVDDGGLAGEGVDRLVGPVVVVEAVHHDEVRVDEPAMSAGVGS